MYEKINSPFSGSTIDKHGDDRLEDTGKAWQKQANVAGTDCWGFPGATQPTESNSQQNIGDGNGYKRTRVSEELYCCCRVMTVFSVFDSFIDRVAKLFM